uniref:Metalloendopeptidase n=1 Tax=Panagrolaimus sp. JU765 TaxID=591449 RepID=A0AC34QKZ5_9BILA
MIHEDIILSPKQIQMRKYNGVREATIKETANNRWENNVVPYVLSNKYTTTERKIIEKSIKKIEEISCFRFPKRTSEKNYLDIDKRDGCYSFVGKIGGRQILSLSGGCIYSFIIIHELFHVLGIEHEHQRPDRDQFIKIIYNNVDPDKMSNFALISPNDVYYKEHPYDYRSIMHYDGTAFGKNDPKTGKKLATMVPLQRGIELHDNYDLTDLDIKKLNDLGKCGNYQKNNNYATCTDNAENCQKYKTDGLCTSAQYKDLMTQQCALTCQFCSTTFSNPTCQDHIDDCSKFAGNGFCNNKFYESSKMLCRKTCGLCK